ncbi:hypothetical protein, partial [Deinococcus saxicola]|uniref:hypothetical protein n=1 Tax=Deinococcus saxicola TaxID=249406 RepID=UPI0039EED33F
MLPAGGRLDEWVQTNPGQSAWLPRSERGSVWLAISGKSVEMGSYGFRLFRVEIGTAPIPPLHVRNPFFSFSLCSDFQVFSTPFNR